jgi:diguanylate cyclase
MIIQRNPEGVARPAVRGVLGRFSFDLRGQQPNFYQALYWALSGRRAPNTFAKGVRARPERAGREFHVPFLVPMLVVIGIIASVFSSLLGTGFGWFLHRQFSRTQLEVELATSKNLKAKDRSSRTDAENERAAELMLKLAVLTEGVVSEVGKHSGDLEAINAELATAKEGDVGAVVGAVQKILKANEKMQEELVAAEARLQQQQAELAAQTEAARTDQLTKITNRRALDEELRKCVLEFERSAKAFSIMVLDVDHFKKFNDTHGHLAGDEVLKFVAQHVKGQLRDTELVARYGGEEFVVIFRAEGVLACRNRADTLRQSIHEKTFVFEGKELRVAASAGVAEIGIEEDEKGLIRRADEALYASKKAGRNCAHWNDGRKNIPITPALLSKLHAQEPAPAASPKPRRFELYDVRFSDASFSPNLDRRVAEWKRTGHPFSIALCAIDGQEEIRKEHGKEMLQRMVTAASSVVAGCLRDMDQMASFGEGGYAISLPTAKIPDATMIADRVRMTVEKLYVPAGALPKFTVSLGVAEIIEGNDSSRLFDRAQRALEAAQEGGGNSTSIHDGLNAVAASSVRQAILA